MKKIIFVLATLLIGINSAFAISPAYKGYGELYSGYAIPSGDYYDGGFHLWSQHFSRCNAY